jgi:D-sedoheptulose 7-phosphate isomerase
MQDVIRAEFSKSLAMLQAMAADAALEDQVQQVVRLCATALRARNKILFAGNGGSAADAQHWAGELVGRFHFNRPGLPAMALTTDTSILTACGNDYGYDYVFARQLEALAVEGDIFFAISTSGNSKNILRAVATAREKGLKVIGFTGLSGGALPALCDICFRPPSDDTPKIQEGHELLGHLICGLIERELFGETRAV